MCTVKWRRLYSNLSFNPVAGLTPSQNTSQIERELCSKMPIIKFSYFDIEAKGELTRLLLHAGNFDFEDDRLPISSWPGEHKEKTTFGQLPMLSWDGVELAQSMAIARSNFPKFENTVFIPSLPTNSKVSGTI